MVSKWDDKLALEFFNKIGLEKGNYVLDFGCGEGFFTIPAAQKVTKEGRVFALDIDAANLNKLKEKAKKKSMENIETVNSNGDLQTKFQDNYFDMILIYDVLHMFNKRQREEILDEFHRILKDRGRLSIYPKHTADNFPLHELKHTYVDQLVKEIECHKFALENRIKTKILHNEEVQEDNVYNFKKELLY
jgi:ubiquinone/menaquinone biosynthesis C-methylase UbiE